MKGEVLKPKSLDFSDGPIFLSVRGKPKNGRPKTPSAREVDSEAFNRYQAMFAEPLSASKHAAMLALFRSSLTT